MKKLLIVGAGGIAGAHVRAIARIPDVSISGVCDVVPARAKKLIDDYHLDADIATNAVETINERRSDYVLVLTPADARLSIIRACADAGTAVFMEKPPCSRMDEGEEMRRLIEEAELIHGVGFMSRYNESLNRVLPLICEEKLSMIAVTFTAPFTDPAVAAKYPYPFEADRSGGLVGDQGIHYVDVCRYIAGSDVKSVRAVGVNQTLLRSEQITTCDTAAWLIEMANDVLVSHAHTWNAKDWECRIDIITDRSDVVVDMFRNTAQGTLAGADFKFAGDTRDPQAFEAENRAFLEAVEKHDMAPVRSTFADALESFRVVQEINRQIYNL